MRTKFVFSLSLLIPFTLVLIYVWTTAADVPFRDEILMIPGGPVESYLKGTLTFADFWRPMASERFLGYNLLQIINVRLFAMNSKNLVLSATTSLTDLSARTSWTLSCSA